MSKKLIITEKPSVARDFARVLGVSGKRNGCLWGGDYVITWCVGHLVEMVYPEEYDPKYKKWALEDLPFLPRDYKYAVIPSVRSQYDIVHELLHSPEIDTVYWAGDSGKEGQTIEENIRNFGGVRSGMRELRVWIDSQTDDEIRRGIEQAKPMSEYAALGRSGIMRAMEDYALGINFSRALTLKYGRMINNAAAARSYTAIAVGRVMTCVLGMVVDREREIRNFKETVFYRVIGSFQIKEKGQQEASPRREVLQAEWRSDEKSVYRLSPRLYKDSGFTDRAHAEELIHRLEGKPAIVEALERSNSKKKAPPLFNLAELQAECAKQFKISPDETLSAAQVLYERKLTTYPRSDARVLTTAVAKEIGRNLELLRSYPQTADCVEEILSKGWHKGIEKSQYTDDSKVTDHYAIIPTGQTSAVQGLNELQKKVYELIVRRFLSIFYPPAEYRQLKLQLRVDTELFTASEKVLVKEGYLKVAAPEGSGTKKPGGGNTQSVPDMGAGPEGTALPAEMEKSDGETGKPALEALLKLKKGDLLDSLGYETKEGKTSPPKRYTSGTMILAMENAGNLIEDEDLRAQIRNTGIGTSATRAEIIRKLIKNGYLCLNNKTQVLTPGGIGEMIYEVVRLTVPSLLNPKMSASWEKGLEEIANEKVDVVSYREKLEAYIRKETLNIVNLDQSVQLADCIEQLAPPEGAVRIPVRKLGLACPVCGGELTTTSFGYGCSNYRREEAPCRFSVGRIAGVRLGEADFRKLITEGRTAVLEGFRSKAGKTFSAAVVLEKEENGYRTRFDFEGNKAPDQRVRAPEDMKCPVCGGRIHTAENGFICENHAGGCGFSVGLIRGVRLTAGELRTLIKEGTTPVIQGFEAPGGGTFAARIGFRRDETGRITGFRFLTGSGE